MALWCVGDVLNADGGSDSAVMAGVSSALVLSYPLFFHLKNYGIRICTLTYLRTAGCNELRKKLFDLW